MVFVVHFYVASINIKFHYCRLFPRVKVIEEGVVLPATTEGLSSSRRLGALFRLLLYSSSRLQEGG